LWQNVCGFGIGGLSPVTNRQLSPGQADGDVSLNRDGAGPTSEYEPIPRFDFNTGQLDADGGFYQDNDSIDNIPHIADEPVLEYQDNDDEDVTVWRSTRTRIPVVGNRLVDLANEVLLATSVQDTDYLEDPKPSALAQGELFCYSSLYPFDLLPFTFSLFPFF
jgi:hypothetical protein